MDRREKGQWTAGCWDGLPSEWFIQIFTFIVYRTTFLFRALKGDRTASGETCKI